MATVKVIPRSLTDAYKRREGDFSPNLVGFQFTDGVSLFTFGNFQITTNVTPKLNKNFVLGGQWSEYYNLDTLNLTEAESEILLSNEIFVRLNFDPKKIDRYVYFGSFHEYVRVTIEQIIQKWKGSLYLNPTAKSNFALNTVLSFSYNPANNTANFLVPKSTITNPFELIVDQNNNFIDLTPTDIFNLSRDYNKYVVSNTNGSFKVIGYTGSTTNYDYINIITQGNPFPTLTASTFGQYTYHIKPNSVEVEMFFNQLNDFERVLLNRLTTPLYTATFSVPKDVEGNIQFIDETFTWPVTDGYNLDIDTRDYAEYVESVLEVAMLFDENKTDLMARRFVSESIHEFDTNGGTVVGLGEDTYGRKVNKLLRIYGREYDEVKKYIDGISFANVVTYNKFDNTSDELIKIMAKTLGFDVLLTVGTDNFNLLEQIQPAYQTPFSGYSRSLSSIELDIELWRRLVINAWWLFRSKGTRKVIEFFFSLFKIPQCMITLNEYVYLAENRLDVQKVYDEIVRIYELVGIGNDVNLTDLPMDLYGFPNILPETNLNYFQMNGFWYNGGTEITTGNNPHIGPYDYGQSYYDQFECFVPNFNTYLTASTLVTVVKNYFNNYNKGSFIFDQNGLPVPYYGTGYANTLNNDGLVDNVVVNSAGLTYVGGSNSPNYARPSGDTYSMKVSFTAGSKNVCDPCAIYQLTFGPDGIVYVIGDPNTPLNNQLCCKYYWLPTTLNAPVCPNAADLMISVNGEVLLSSNGQTVSQDCCSKAILGFDVVWDGKGCVVPQQNCPKPNEMAITTGGVVIDINTNGTVSEQCCTESNLGFAVVWSGKECLASTSNGGGGGGTAVGTDGVKTYSANELFLRSFSTSSEVAPSNYTCYWCPPEIYVQTICSVDDYLATSTDAQIIQFAIKLGAPSNVSLIDATTFISNIYTPFFNTYGCIILDDKDNMIKDNACCTLRGGTLTNINGVNYCIKGSPNPCAGSQIANMTHVWVTPNNTLLPQSCCNQTGQYWISPVSPNGNNITLTTQNGVITFLDIPGSTFAGQSSSYCSSCPSNIIEVVASNGVFITDSNNNMLSQQCCVDYGFNWDQNTSQCSKCPTAVNYGTPLDDTVITDLNGNDLTQQCCTQVGGYYGDTNGQGSKCYICPPLNLFNNTIGVSEPNSNYQVSNGEVTYLGSSLTQQCCLNYNAEFGNVSWNSIEHKCLVNIPCPPEPTSYNNNGYSIQGITSDCSLGTVAWLAYNGNTQVITENCCNNIKNNVYLVGASNNYTIWWDSNFNLCRICANG